MLPNVNDIIDMWSKDSVMDGTEPGKELLRIPTLHAKYTRFLTSHSLAAKRCMFDFAKMKRVKLEYYNGRMDQDELEKYGWEPFRFLLKSDISSYLEADEDLQKLLMKKSLHDVAVEHCTMIIKELNSRTFQLRSFIDWEKFIQGQR